MKETSSSRTSAIRFSLRQLLTLTAIVAIAISLRIAYRKNQDLLQTHSDLISLTSRHLKVDDQDALASMTLPSVAPDFQSWQVYVPQGKSFRLQLGVGSFFRNSVPTIVATKPLDSGQHRVTLQIEDSPSEGYRFTVYLDGEQIIHRSMGSQWMPHGWSSATGMAWPEGPPYDSRSKSMQLAAQHYTPRVKIGRRRFFNGQRDPYVTHPGYRLWIDETGISYPAPSPFLGLQGDGSYQGIGLRDGFRLLNWPRNAYAWSFTRPASETSDPILEVFPEFFNDQRKALSSGQPTFQSWEMCNDALGRSLRKWIRDPSESKRSVFLKAKIKGESRVTPVIEVQWDRSKPNTVGLRMPDSPLNEQITHWSLRINDGTKHLWRIVEIGDRELDARKPLDDESNELTDRVVTLVDKVESDLRMRWLTNESLPLQIAAQPRQSPYAGLQLYRGLPLEFSLQIPEVLHPTIHVKRIAQDQILPDESFPGGPVYGEIQVHLEAKPDEWIWLQAKSRDNPSIARSSEKQ